MTRSSFLMAMSWIGVTGRFSVSGCQFAPSSNEM
jgi:hypothetical protein